MCLEKSFSEFWDEYKEGLEKYKLHRWKFISLLKANTVDKRKNCLQVGDVALQHDFTEALTINHNSEVSTALFVVVFIFSFSQNNPVSLHFCSQIQSKHFGNSLTVSIEGYTVDY